MRWLEPNSQPITVEFILELEPVSGLVDLNVLLSIYLHTDLEVTQTELTAAVWHKIL